MLVSRPIDHPIIGTKRVYRNKLDDNEVVVRNKARLVAKSYNQKKFNFNKTFALVARLEVIKLFLIFVYFMDILLRRCMLNNLLILKIMPFHIIFSH